VLARFGVRKLTRKMLRCRRTDARKIAPIPSLMNLFNVL
jgi:hypothetical protein